jgi:hypothetical protein
MPSGQIGLKVDEQPLYALVGPGRQDAALRGQYDIAVADNQSARIGQPAPGEGDADGHGFGLAVKLGDFLKV